MEKQFDAENPLTLTLKGMDFLDFACLTKNFSTLQSRLFGRGTEKFGLFANPLFTLFKYYVPVIFCIFKYFIQNEI
jgi:hypothetical protein